MLLSFTSSMSGSEFIAQRKFAFQVFGSGSFSPTLYLPINKRWGECLDFSVLLLPTKKKISFSIFSDIYTSS